MKVKLKKDIVIKAGSIFEDAPHQTIMDENHVEYIFGLSKNTSGSVIYSVDPLEFKEWGRWFEKIK